MFLKIIVGFILGLLLGWFGMEWWQPRRRATASTDQTPTDQPKN